MSAPPAAEPVILAVDDFSLLPPPSLTAWHYQQINEDVTDANTTVSTRHTQLPHLSTHAAPHTHSLCHRVCRCQPYGLRQLQLPSSSSTAVPATLHLTPSTPLSFVYCHTRLLLLCDVSASLSVIDPATARPLYATLIDSMAATLRHLAASPLLSPSVGCSLYVSIVAHKSQSATPFYVLCQAALHTADGVDAMVEMACSRLMEVENQQADEQQQWHPDQHKPTQKWSDGREGEREAEDDEPLSSLIASSHSTASSTSFQQLLRHALFFLDRMPSCAASAIVLLSDSVLALSPSLSSYESTAALLLRRSIALSVVQLTSVSSLPTFSFGYVADAEVVRHIVRSTGGWFGSSAEVTLRLPDDRQLSALDQAVFVRKSNIAPWPERHKPPRAEDMLPALTRHRGRPTTASVAPSLSSPFAELLSFQSLSSSTPLSTPSPAPLTRSWSQSSFSLSPASFLLRERVKRYDMTADVLRLLECRTREGFTAYVQPAYTADQQVMLLRREHSAHVYIDYTVRVDSSRAVQQQPQQTATIHVYGSGSRPTVLKLTRGGNLGDDRQSPQLEVEVHVTAQRTVLDALLQYRQSERERPSKHLNQGGRQQLERNEVDSLPSSVWSYVCEMERSDILLTQLAKVALDAVELRFTHAKSQLLTTTTHRSSHEHYVPPTLPSHHSTPSSPPHTSLADTATQSPLTITLPPPPPFIASSYLSPSHPLWHFLAGCPTSRWRRFFPLHHMSVLCSLHRTSQLELRLEMELELELEIDFQTLARVHEKSAVSSSFARAVSSVALPSSGGVVNEADDGAMADDVGDGGLRHPRAIRSGLGQQEVAAALCRLLQGWSSITVSNSFFVFLPSRPSQSSDIDSPLSAQSLSDAFDNFVSSSLPLVLVRLAWKTKFLAAITLAFHACDPHTRATVTHSLAILITNASITAKRRSHRAEHRQDEGFTWQQHGGTQQEEEEKRPDDSEPTNVGGDRELVLNRVNSLASRRSSIPNLSPSMSPSRRGGGVLESVRPFGVIDQAVETIILRPSSIIAGSTSASLFHTLFPPPSPSSRLLSTSTAPSFSSSRRLLALLRSYMRYHSWMWELPSSVSMKSTVRLLRTARAEEGFVLVASISSSSTWLRELTIVQAAADERTEMDEAESEAFIRQLSTNTAIQSPTSPERPALMLRSLSTPNLRHAALGAAHHVHSLPSLLSSSSPLALFPPSSHPPRTAGVPSSCFIQYSVTEIDATHIQTELWMEPFYGLVHCPIPLPHLSDVPSSPFPRSPQQARTAAFHTLTSEQLFVHLSSWIHSCDLHLLSAVSTFDSVRDLELDPEIATQMARRAEGKGHAGPSKGQQQQQWGLDDTYSSSGLALQLVDDFHAVQGWDFDRDSRCRLLSRFTSAHCHPRLMLSIGTVSRLLGLLKAGSASALYAQLKAHGGSMSDMSQLGDRERSASALSSVGVSHSSSMDELHSMSRMRRNSSAVSVAHSEDEDDPRRLSSPPPATLHTPPSHRGFTLTSPVAASLTSPIVVSPIVSPLPSSHAPLFSSPPRTARAMPQSGDATNEVRRQEARKQRRLRREREMIPYSLTYLLECSPSLTSHLPLPSSTQPSFTDEQHITQSSPSVMARTAPLSTQAVTPQRSPADTVSEGPRRSPVSSAHSHSHSTSSLPNIYVTPPSSSHTTHATFASRSAHNTPKQQQSTTGPLDSHATNSGGIDELQHSSSADCVHDMLVRTVRRLSDVELIEGRCFAQLVNEYTIVLVLLPQQPSHSAPVGPNHASTGFRPSRVARSSSEENRRKAEEEERQRKQRERDTHTYLDHLLALHSAHLDRDSNSSTYTVALYECSRDEFSHPRIFWPEGDSLPVISSSLSLSSLPASDSHTSFQGDSRSSSSVSPLPTPPRSPQRQPHSPRQSPSAALPSSYTLCDGRGPPQLSFHKQAVLMAHVRTNALRYLFSTPPLVSHHLMANTHTDVLRALALASGTAHVVHAPLSPAVTPNKDMQSPSPLLSPVRSPAEKKKAAGRGGQLLTSPTSNRTAFQLDDTIDEDAARQMEADDEGRRQAAVQPSVDANRQIASDDIGEEEDGGEGQFDTPLQEQRRHSNDSTPLATPLAPRLDAEEEEDATTASPAAAFSTRLSTAYMRDYAKVVYMQLKRQPLHVDETDLQRTLQQCEEYHELLDLSDIQRPTAVDGTAETSNINNPFSAVKVLARLHEQLYDILAARLVQLAEHELFVWTGGGADDESSQPQQQPASGLSILRALTPTVTPTPTSAQVGAGARRGSYNELLHSTGSISSADGGGVDASGNRLVDDDAKGEMAAFPLPLFVQLRAIVRPSAVGITALQTAAVAGGQQLPLPPPVQLETAVTAETDWSELAMRMLAYQQPDWWPVLRPTSTSKAGNVLGEAVECVLVVKGHTLPRYSDRAPDSTSQPQARTQAGHVSALDVTLWTDSPGSPTRSVAVSGMKWTTALYSGMPSELRTVMQSLYHHIEQAVGECQAALA